MRFPRKVTVHYTVFCVSHAIADNHLDQQFNPTQPNQVWSTDITYLRTAEGWLYLAIVMDLHSRRIVGWAMDRRMTQALVARALMMAIALRKPDEGLLQHSDRGSQYTSKRYRKLLAQHGMISSMSGHSLIVPICDRPIMYNWV